MPKHYYIFPFVFLKSIFKKAMDVWFLRPKVPVTCREQHGDSRVLLENLVTLIVQEHMFPLARFQTQNL